MNGIEAQYRETVDVIRLSLLGSIGRDAAAIFGVRVVPTTIIVDGQGTVLARQAGVPDKAQIVEHLRAFESTGRTVGPAE